MLWNIVKLECKKAICNKFFILVVVIGIGITFLSLIPSLESYLQDMEAHLRISEEFGLRNPLMPMETLFNHWIGGEPHSTGSQDYFLLFPLLISIPYGWSYCAERRSGYEKNVVIRTGRLRYYFAKYLALFLSGGLAMVLPQLFNFLLAAMFFPAVTPSAVYDTAYGISASSFMSMLFYTRPFLYVILYLFIDFLLCGLIACLCFVLSVLVKRPVMVTLLPFFLLLGFSYLCQSFVYRSSTVIYTELSPMTFLRATPATYDTNGFVVFGWAAVLFLLTFLPVVLRGIRHEIY
ncbi:MULTISPECIES: hypothetical protein [unclassified Emergencia]|uniref:hypothetical protein n=1 Tax=unclassified Emergencia TaxID=2642996 RepID=UPI001379AB5B|nr:hypothetical protein [Emergencia sp. 1XD21-10]MCI9639902.1 hypothetical protein [Emergencia sp.]NCE98235.1 hypothetical protein [Emergencia sp. 1XD21-10]